MSRPILFGGVVFDNPYIDPPTIPAGQSCIEYRLSRNANPRRRSWLRRAWRRVHGH